MSETIIIAAGIGAINIIGLVLASFRFKSTKDKSIYERLNVVENQTTEDKTNIENMKDTLKSIQSDVKTILEKII